MSRRRHTGAATPHPHPPTRPETVLIIVIVLAGAWLASRGMDPVAIMQVLGGVGVTGVAVVSRLQRLRRIAPVVHEA